MKHQISFIPFLFYVAALVACAGPGGSTASSDDSRPGIAEIEGGPRRRFTVGGRDASADDADVPDGSDTSQPIALDSVDASVSPTSPLSDAAAQPGDATAELDAGTEPDAARREPPRLIITRVGTGGGEVASQPIGIVCGEHCEHPFEHGTKVTLIPTADDGSLFVGFDGHPLCMSGTFTLESTITCTAKFAHPLSLTFPLVDQVKLPGATPIMVALSLSGRFLAVLSDFSNQLYMFRANALTGALKQFGNPASIEADPNFVAITPDEKFVYTLHEGLDQILVLPIDEAKQELNQSEVGDFTTSVDKPRSIGFDELGRFAYVLSGSGKIFTFSITPDTGQLQLIGDKTIATKPNPLSMTIAPKTNLAYIGRANDNTVYGYRIDKPTDEPLVATSLKQTRKAASSIAVTPDEQFAFAIHYESNPISVFRHTNDASGEQLFFTKYEQIDEWHGLGPARGPWTIATGSGGKLLYVLNRWIKSASVSFIHVKSGRLTFLTSWMTTTEDPRSIAVAQNGKFVYIADGDKATVTWFTVGSND